MLGSTCIKQKKYFQIQGQQMGTFWAGGGVNFLCELLNSVWFFLKDMMRAFTKNIYFLQYVLLLNFRTSNLNYIFLIWRHPYNHLFPRLFTYNLPCKLPPSHPTSVTTSAARFCTLKSFRLVSETHLLSNSAFQFCDDMNNAL